MRALRTRRLLELTATIFLMSSSAYANYPSDKDQVANNGRSFKHIRNDELPTRSEVALPEDQSNERAYIDRTAAIRKEVVNDKQLSTLAKNVKIITLNDGTVVLRGLVESSGEKNRIEQIAQRFSDGAFVQSHLMFDADQAQ